MKIRKNLLLMLTLTMVFLFFSICTFAQADSTATHTVQTLIGLLSTKFSWFNAIINIVTVVVGALILFLPGLQYVLKKIPTTESVKISGWLGTALDWATWWQDDVKTDKV